MTAGDGVAGIVLAGGTGSRLGRTKQLLPVGGRPMLQHVVDTAIAELDHVVVVLGHDANRVARALQLRLGVRTVVNPHFADGQSTSLAVGLAAVSGAEAAVVLLGDEPGVQPAAVRTVVDAYRTTSGPVIQATYGGRPGHPVLLGRTVWASLGAVQGDCGARAVLRRHPGWVVAVELGTAPVDVDTWEDYRLVCASQGRPASTPQS